MNRYFPIFSSKKQKKTAIVMCVCVCYLSLNHWQIPIIMEGGDNNVSYSNCMQASTGKKILDTIFVAWLIKETAIMAKWSGIMPAGLMRENLLHHSQILCVEVPCNVD